MATFVTLADLTTHVRERANMENGTFVTDDEIKHYLNDEIADLYAKMVNVEEGKIFTTIAQTLVQIGDNAYQLPSDFMRVVDVNVYTRSRWAAAYEADSQDYYQLLERQYRGDYDTRYFLRLNQEQGRYELFLFPAKDVDNIGVRYVPEAPQLSLSTDTLKWPSNWHEPCVVGAAAKCLTKEESEASHLFLERDRGHQRVLKDIRTQAVAEIQTLRQTASRNRRRRRSSSLNWWG